MDNPNPSPAIPEAPDVGRYWQFYPLHVIGILVLLAIPIMALLGVFGRATGEVTATNSTVQLVVTYPERIRYKEAVELHIAVRNVSASALDGMTAQISADYIDSFTEPAFIPAAERITADDYVVDLEAIQLDETRRVTIGLRAERYGWLAGVVTVRGAGEPIRVDFGTTVFP